MLELTIQCNNLIYTLQTPPQPLDGDSLWRKFKGLQTEATKSVLHAWRKACPSGRLPSGNGLIDVLKETRFRCYLISLQMDGLYTDGATSGDIATSTSSSSSSSSSVSSSQSDVQRRVAQQQKAELLKVDMVRNRFFPICWLPFIKVNKFSISANFSSIQ